MTISFSSRLNRVAPAALIVLSFAIVGCGKSGLDTRALMGKVTYGGGPCEGGGVIYFAPVENGGGGSMHPVSADFTPEGTFYLHGSKQSAGLVPGTYRVRVQCVLQQPTDYGKPATTWGPGTFTLPELLIVRADDSSVELSIDIPRKS